MAPDAGVPDRRTGNSGMFGETGEGTVEAGKGFDQKNGGASASTTGQRHPSTKECFMVEQSIWVDQI